MRKRSQGASWLLLLFSALLQLSNARGGAASGASGAAPRLQFAPDGTFKIVMLTDLHMGEQEHLDQQSREVGRACAGSS